MKGRPPPPPGEARALLGWQAFGSRYLGPRLICEPLNDAPLFAGPCGHCRRSADELELQARSIGTKPIQESYAFRFWLATSLERSDETAATAI